MAYASDRLKEYRKNKMPSMPMGEDGQADEKEEESKPSDRSVMLTDMEQKSLGDSYQPGQTVTCEVTGRLNDGKLDIIEIKPSGGPVDADAGMGSSVRMNPAIAPS